MQIIEKWRFIQKTRKEFNEKNSYALIYLERIFFQIERNIILKFIFVIASMFFLIILLNYFFNNLMGDWLTSVYVNYINFPLSDEDSARYFFSTIPQSLAALIAISFTVLLIYLQISTDKYSIQTVRSVFNGWGAVTVLSIFLITIIYSLFKLGKVREMGNTTFPWDHEMKTIFILTILCIVSLILLFYKIISSLIPENFIRESNERIKKASIGALDFIQLIRIKNLFFKNKINSLKNVEESYFFGGLGLLGSEHPITTQKSGFVQDIDFTKIDNASKLLSSISEDYKLQLNIPIEGRVSSATNVLGYIICSTSKTIPEVESLVEKAYKINSKKIWMIEDYKELEPISSLTIKAIKDFEKGIAKIALEELADTIIYYIKARKNFGLMPPSEQNKGRIGRNLLDESFNQLEKIMKVGIRESDSDIIKLILRFNQKIGYESINLQDLDAFIKVTKFYLYFSHRLEDDFIDRILHESNNLEIKILFDLENERKNIDYVKGSKSILEEVIDYYGNLTKILIDKQNRFTIISLSKLFGMNRDIERLMYDNRQFELKIKLEQLKPENSEYIKIKNELEVIEEKERIGKELKLNIDFKVYSIGTYLMVNIEREKHTIDFSRPIFDKLADFYMRNNLEETFGRLPRIDFVTIDHWFYEIDDGEAHFIDTNHIDRFYLLMNVILYRKGKKLNEVRVIDQFNKTQLETFKAEYIKLKDKIHLWDQLLENGSQKYFNKFLGRLEECAAERNINLGNKIRQAELSIERVEKVKSDIVSHTKRYSEARNFINVEDVTEEDTDSILFGKNTLFDKIYLLDKTVDPTTFYGYDNIGEIIGRQIGMGESNHLIKQIFEGINIKENIIYFDILSIQNLNTAKEILEERGVRATTILMSFDLIHELWRIKEFTHSKRQTEKIPTPYGILDGVEIYRNRVLPKGVAVIFEKTRIATLKIIEKLNPIIATDFDKEEIIKKELKEGKIKDEQKDKRLEELDEKVNIKALEKIKFEFGNNKAGLVLFFKSSEPQK